MEILNYIYIQMILSFTANREYILYYLVGFGEHIGLCRAMGNYRGIIYMHIYAYVWDEMLK